MKSKPLLMGVLNVTPDSFYDGGAYFSLEKGVERALEMQEEGADILDIGGVSSRPGAASVSAEEEMRRVLPLLEALRSSLKIPLSIDTATPKVARRAVEMGAALINDITGFSDPEMVEIAAGCSADLCVMHMQGTPQTMQIAPSYPEGVVEHILRFFEERSGALIKAGVEPERIILDPGIGFGKNLEHCLKIFKSLHKFRALGFRMLIGASRKSFLGKILNKQPTELLTATVSIHTIAILGGADFVRAHDVKEHREMIDLISFFL